MSTPIRAAQAPRCLLVFAAMLLLPLSVEAQPVLSVSPPSVSVQATQGTNAQSQTLQISNAGNRALKWSVQENSSLLSVSPTSGVNNGTVTLTFQTSGLAVGPHPPATIRVESNGGSRDISVQLTVLAAPGPGTLTVTCPANISVPSSNGSAVVVNYTVTTSGGVAPVTVTGVPASGNSFPVGTTTVQVNVTSNDGQTASCSFTVTVTFTSGVNITASPTTPAPGSTVTAVFSGVANPSSTDWIAMSPAGSAPNIYWEWKWASSCTLTPGTARASGSCPFTAATTAGPYEFRLFANNGFTLLDSGSFTVTPSGPATLTVTCPANISVASPNLSGVVVNYTVTTSGGQAPVTVTGTPPSGSSFPVGTTSVQVTANSADGQTKTCGFTVTVTSSPPSTGVGPQPSITCPSGAVDIFPGTNNIQTMVDLSPAGTTFCLRAGTFSVTQSITPKSGNSFVGEYGAILDGTGWTDTDTTHGAFRAFNQDIDFVTIRNLVIRDMPQSAIFAYYQQSGHWTITNNEIASNFSGIVFPSDAIVRNNHIHHNFNFGYQGSFSDNSMIEDNEINNNGWEQKVMESLNVIFRRNFVHHNEGSGIWFDSNNVNALIEDNRVEDNGYIGIWYEISSHGTIRNNTVKRTRDTGIFLSTSRDTDVYDNTLEGNFRGITYFMNCPSFGGSGIGFDLVNNDAYDNTIIVGTQSGALATVFSYAGCTATQLAPYENGEKNLKFFDNTYDVPVLTGQYWYWNAFKTWAQWQDLGHDLTGIIQ